MGLVRDLFTVEHTLRHALADIVLGSYADQYLASRPLAPRLRVRTVVRHDLGRTSRAVFAVGGLAVAAVSLTVLALNPAPFLGDQPRATQLPEMAAVAPPLGLSLERLGPHGFAFDRVVLSASTASVSEPGGSGQSDASGLSGAPGPSDTPGADEPTPPSDDPGTPPPPGPVDSVDPGVGDGDEGTDPSEPDTVAVEVTPDEVVVVVTPPGSSGPVVVDVPVPAVPVSPAP